MVDSDRAISHKLVEKTTIVVFTWNVEEVHNELSGNKFVRWNHLIDLLQR